MQIRPRARTGTILDEASIHGDRSAPGQARAFNISMAVLLVLSMIPAVLPDLVVEHVPEFPAHPHVEVVGGFVFVSGIGARRPHETFVGVRVIRSGVVELDIHEHARATIENVREILRPVGGTLSDVAEIDAFLVSMDDDEGFSGVHARYFDGREPARTTVAARAPAHPHQLLMPRAVARAARLRS